jgi:hypothetical protein
VFICKIYTSNTKDKMLLEQQEEIEEFNPEELNHIREKIELMSKFNQVEVLRILSKYNNIVLNENKYGIHVNLTDVPKEVVDKIKTFIEYVNTQENTLNVIEMQKEDFKNTYFTNDIKDNASKKSNPNKTNNKKR